MKWAKCNVGAESETDYGYYFQWGDIVDKSNADCSWATYKHCNGSVTTMKKYNSESYYGIVDNIETLEAKDDAATQIMGGDWRMPTKDEFQELFDNTKYEWITNYNGSGVNGYKFTSNKEGYQNNSIFIPAAGLREGSSFDGQGIHGEVWSSSVDTSDAWTLYFYGSDDVIPDSESYRCRGHSVRGVFK